MDLLEVGLDWIKLAEDRDRRREIVDAVRNLQGGSIKCGEFLD
jgi:hypothetical protein